VGPICKDVSKAWVQAPRTAWFSILLPKGLWPTTRGGMIMKENEMTLLCVLLVTQIYNDVRKIVREELERVGLGEKTE